MRPSILLFSVVLALTGCAKAAPDVSATTHVAKASDFKLCI